jgi:deoxynucleoside triphosphate triphosphohydrolase SAMHD1
MADANDTSFARPLFSRASSEHTVTPDNNPADTVKKELLERSMHMERKQRSSAKDDSPMTKLPGKATITAQGPVTPTIIKMDSIYGMMTLSKASTLVIKHWVFQRLRFIKQLGTLPFHDQYKMACHNRFDHSCGVAYLARVAALTAQRQHPQITNKEVFLVELAGLCHDLGHGPYSHSFDKMLKKIKLLSPAKRHEYRSQCLFQYLIRDLIKDNFPIIMTDSDIRLVQYFIDPKGYCEHFAKVKTDPSNIPKCVTPFYPGLQHIVNSDSSVDVDKMDYLLRDGLMLGWEKHLNKKVDVVFLLKRCRIVNSGVWAFNITDFASVYELVCRRYLLYSNAYTNEEVTAYDTMVTDALIKADNILKFSECAKLENEEHIRIFCGLTDSYMAESILNNQSNAMEESKDLIERVLTGKNLYTKVGEFHTAGDSVDTESYQYTDIYNVSDKSAPLNLIPLISCHLNGVLQPPNTYLRGCHLYVKTSNV